MKKNPCTTLVGTTSTSSHLSFPDQNSSGTKPEESRDDVDVVPTSIGADLALRQCRGGRAPIAALILVFVAIFGALLLSGCRPPEVSTANSAGQTLYTCGMHPQVIQDKPGNCPICGMKLTPVRKQGDTGSVAGSDSTIRIDGVTVQNMDLRTAPVMRGPVQRTVRTVGIVDFDEAALAEVTTKFKGWIERLYVDTTGQQVHRGQPLFEIYAPELYSAQTEYVLAMNEAAGTNRGAELIRRSALDKLRYFDVSEEQINELEKTRQVKKTLRLSAPRDGIVFEKMVVEGQMVDAGMKLYRLADLGTVWVMSQIYEQDLPFVRLGQEAVVSLSYLPDRKFRGRVTFIYPTVDDKTRTARVRMEFHNPGFFLKPGMFATVELSAELSPSALLVPDMAVLRSGERNTVFVALDGGRFEPRTVMLGARAQDNQYEILAGLKEGERVVTSGQFMLDSESQLREAIQKMGQPMGGESTAVPAKVTSQSSNNVMNMTGSGEKLLYICPMPEHVALEYDQPGKCPLCGMTLVPVSKETLARIQPGGRIEYWTCPMPEHKEVHESKPGKCPRCGMTLIPVMVQASQGTPSRGPRMPGQEQNVKLYTCPMSTHADVVSDKPGFCPKCGMQLVETSTVSHGKAAEQHWREGHAAPWE